MARALGVGAEKLRHRGGVRFAGCRIDVLGQRQLIEGWRRRDDEDGRIVHAAAPFLAVRRDDADRHAPHPTRGVRSIRIADRNREAPDHRVASSRQHRRRRKVGAGAVRFELAGEADALGVVSPMAERIAASIAQGRNHAARRQSAGAEPAAGVSEGKGEAADY